MSVSKITMSPASLATAVQMKVLAMAKDQAEQTGQSMVQMMQKSVDPNLGQKIDIQV